MAIDLVARLSLDDQLSGPMAALNSKLMGMVGFAAVTAGVGKAVSTFADFDTAMRKAATIAGATDDEFVKMSEAAKELGASTSLSATQVADAMTEMAAKGYTATQVIDAMPGVIAAAEASGEDLATTADVVSTALNVWGMKASEANDVADVLAMTANATAAGITDMQYALKYAGAPAKALGMSLEEVSAAAGLIVNQGIDGSTAGTALRQGLTMLASPTKKAQKGMDALGFSMYDANGNVKSMVDVVGALQQSMDGLSDGEKVTMMKSWVGTESMSAFLSLVNSGPEELKKLQTELENSGGSAQEAADKMKAGIGGALEQASGAIETFMINVGDAMAPMVIKFAKAIADMDTAPVVAGLQKFGDKLSELATKMLETDWSAFTSGMATLGNMAMAIAGIVVEHFDKIAVAIKVVLGLFLATKAMSAVVGVFNGIVSVVNLTIGVFNKLKAAFEVAKTVFLVVRGIFMMFPGMWLVTAIGAVIAAGVLLYKNWDTVKAKALALWEDIKSGNSAFSFLMPVIQGAINAFNWLKDTFNTVKDYAAETWQRILEGKSSVLLLLGPLGWLVQAGVELYRNWDTIKGAAMRLWGELKSGERSFASVLGPIGILIDAGVSLYKNWDRIKAGAIALWNKIEMGKGAFMMLKVAMIPVKLAIAVLVGVFNVLKTGVVAVWNVFNKQGPAQLIRNSLKNVMEVAHKVKSAFVGLKEGVSYAMSQARIAVTDAVNGIIDKVNWLIEKLNAIPGVNVPLVAHVKYETSGSVDAKVAKVTNSGSAGTNAVNGPHAIGNHGGWNEIRTDGTLRNLHAGERVLTAVENDGYKQMMSSGLPNAIAKVASMGAPKLEYQSTEQEPFDATEIIGAINRLAKRAINVYVPNDDLAGKLTQMVDVVSDKVGLTSGEAQAVSSTVENSSFSDSVNTITTNNAIAKTASTTNSKVVDVGGITLQATVREEADINKIVRKLTDIMNA